LPNCPIHWRTLYVGCTVMLNHTECHVVISAPKHPPFQSQSSADHWISTPKGKSPCIWVTLSLHIYIQ
jgi:hypothetical protein